MGSSPAPRTPPAQACLAGHASNRPERPGTRPHRGSAAPHSLKGIYPPAGRGGQRARVDLRSRPGRAVRLAHIAAVPPRPRSAATSELGEDQAPNTTGSGGARRSLRRCTRARSGALSASAGGDAGAARPPALFSPPRAPRSLALASAPQARRGRSRGRHHRCGGAEAPVQVASGALTFGAEREVERAVPCCCHSAARPCAMPGEATRETEGPRGVLVCGPVGGALRRGRPGVGGGRGGGERPGLRGGADPPLRGGSEAGTPPAPNLESWV